MMGRRLPFILLCWIFWTPLMGQFSDDFSDGDFTNAPAWSGDVDSFQVSVPLELQSKGSSSGSDIVYLATPSTIMDSVEWNFFLRLDFNPSSTNYVRVYLASNQANLEGSLNGYFIQLGEAGSNPDSIDLFRQDGLTVTKILTGSVGCMASTTTNPVRIRVTRDDLGNWTIFGDCSGGSTLVSQGTVLDNTYSTTTHFGVYCRYSTASRFDKYFFDDFNIAAIVGDTVKPTIVSATPVSATQLDVLFSEDVDLATAQTAGNYAVNNGIGTPSSAVRDGSNFALVHLTFATNFVSPTNYILTVNTVEDLNGNIILSGSTANFTYFVPVAASFHSIRINEIFADPTPVVGLPSAEFIELYNTSAAPFNLSGWKFTDGATTATLGSYVLAPGSYVILCPTANVAQYSVFGPTLGVTSFPSLNNAGDPLGLRDNVGTLVDTVHYLDTWYQDGVKAAGGWTLELINPVDTCATGPSNWIASNDVSGGTPGTQNSVYSIAPDVTAPSILSSTLIAGDTLEICFTEDIILANLSNPANYTIAGGSQSITTIIPLGPPYSCVQIALSAPLTSGIQYIFTLQNMEDCSGNTSTLADTVLNGAPGARFEVLINEIFADPTPQIGLPTQEFVEIYNASANAISLGGWTFSDPTSTVTLPAYTLGAGQYLILASTANVPLFTPFGSVLGLSSLPSLNNSSDSLTLRNANGDLIDEVNYLLAWYQDAVKADGGWTLERINPTDTCATGAANWIASIDPVGGTPGTQNSVFSTAPDVTAPAISSTQVVNANTLRICFSEGIIQPNIGTLTNYSLSGGTQSFTAATPIGNPATCVDLTTSAALDTGVVYIVNALNMEDCAGNTTTLVDTFILGYPGTSNSVIINEIFPDPTPMFGLPGSEFVEIFNISGTYINLAGWTFSDAGSTVSLPPYTMAPNEYLILAGQGNAAAYAPFGTVLPLSSLPGLNNDSDSLTLHNAAGTLINGVNYSIDWYQDPIKEDGGFTLERINPFDTCDKVGNWIGSNDLGGGTPGQQNSVFDPTPDTQAPSILSITVLTPFQIQVCFDETMDVATLQDENNFSADNSIGTPIIATPVGPDFACVNLTFGSSLDTGTVYTLTVTGIADCKGNIASNLTGTFVLGGNALPKQIIITEIFPDYDPPVGLPEAEFIEIYNRGPSVVNLAGFKFTDRTATVATLPAFNLFPGEYLILTSTSNINEFLSYGDVVGLSNFPSLNNTSDSLEIYSPAGVLIDQVYYRSTWYQDDTKKDGGWTLERIDVDFTCQNQGNWRGSVDPSGGTPGTQNSVNSTFVDNEAPSIAYAQVFDPTTIRIFFTEEMDEAELSDVNHYAVDNGIGVPLAAIARFSNFAVDLIIPTALDTNTLYCVTVSNVKDCPGNTMNPDQTVCLGIPVRPQPGDIIINEILFNPYTGGSDYVEIVNLSPNILDLKSLRIGEIFPGTDSIFNDDPVTGVTRLLLPGAYMCLTADKEFQLTTYQPIDPDAIFEMSSFPSYDDTEGECVVITDSGLVLDRFHYLDDYQFPNLDDKNGVSLERLSFTQITQDANNWHSAASTVRYGTPGYKNSQQIEIAPEDGSVWITPKTFSPDQDGFDDVATIHYQFDEPGANVRVLIFDNRGRHVKIVAQNTLVGTDEGFFSWDGTNDAGRKADIGIYVVLFEVVYPSTGETKIYKLPVVLAGRI